MKFLKLYLPAIAILIGLSASITIAPKDKTILRNVSGFYQIDDDPDTKDVNETECRQGIVDQADCPEFFGTVTCTITAGGFAYQAYANRSTDGLTCLAPTLVRRP